MADEKKGAKNQKRGSSIKGMFIGFIIGAIAIAAVGMYMKFFSTEKATVDNAIISSTLEKASELTTAKLKYTGMAKYNDKGVAVINKADFVMVYKATARAGIDLKEVESSVDNDKQIVYITIPKAKIQEVNIDPASIEYYDEKITLFNTDEKEDSDRAQALAEKAAKKEAKQLGVLEYADEQAETVIKGLLEGVIPEGFKIEFKVKEK